MSAPFDVERIRRQFPALSLKVDGRPAVFFDGPAGSQVPERVVQAVSQYLAGSNANLGGFFETSKKTERILENAHQTVADFLGAPDAVCVIFGPNMTSLTFSLSRSVAQTLSVGDEIVVTATEHDANVTPWTLAAREAGATVRRVRIQPDDCTLDFDDFKSKLTDRTKLVAVGYASNLTGSINPVEEIVCEAHAVGALVFVDAVHFAPHGLIDVEQLDCDFLVCSAYKFFGPHVGVLWGKRECLERLPAYKLRPASEALPDRWMTGTQNHEGIAGVAEAVEYLADLGRSVAGTSSRREALHAAFHAIGSYEQQLAARLIEGLEALPGIRILGITDPGRFQKRVPTISFTHERTKPRELARFLAGRGIFVWSGNHYALPVTETLDLEPDGTLRVGLLHYNTSDEIDRLLTALQEFSASTE